MTLMRHANVCVFVCVHTLKELEPLSMSCVNALSFWRTCCRWCLWATLSLLEECPHKLFEHRRAGGVAVLC